MFTSGNNYWFNILVRQLFSGTINDFFIYYWVIIGFKLSFWDVTPTQFTHLQASLVWGPDPGGTCYQACLSVLLSVSTIGHLQVSYLVVQPLEVVIYNFTCYIFSI